MDALAEIREDLAPTGTLRAAINLGNPVLACGTPAAPGGITVDIARELAGRLGLPLELICFDAARSSFEAISQGGADICFLAIEAAREDSVAFSPAYVIIEAVFAVPQRSPIVRAEDVDQPGVRVGVKSGSAYDLYLSRTLTRAQLVRGSDGVTVFSDQQLEVAAGIRQPVQDYAASHPGIRVLEPRFMQIRQALGTTRARHPRTLSYLHRFVEQLKADGFIAAALSRAGRTDATVAPAAD